MVPPNSGVRVQDERDRRVFALALLVTAFEAAVRAGENDFRHGDSFGWAVKSYWEIAAWPISAAKAVDFHPLFVD